MVSVGGGGQILTLENLNVAPCKIRMFEGLFLLTICLTVLKLELARLVVMITVGKVSLPYSIISLSKLPKRSGHSHQKSTRMLVLDKRKGENGGTWYMVTLHRFGYIAYK